MEGTTIGIDMNNVDIVYGKGNTAMSKQVMENQNGAIFSDMGVEHFQAGQPSTSYQTFIHLPLRYFFLHGEIDFKKDQMDDSMEPLVQEDEDFNVFHFLKG